VIDLTWELFRQTGNIETYLLLKELENATLQQEHGQAESKSMTNMDSNI